MRIHAEDVVGTGEIWIVVDADTGQELDGVTWADEATGEYEQARMNDDGTFVVGDDGLILDRKRGNIRMRLRP